MDPQIVGLADKIRDLGHLVIAALSRAVTAFTRGDTLLARAVIDQDADIDQMEVQVQECCVQILEMNQPTGPDLRFVVAVLKINDGLERAGDLAENIARVVVEIGDWDRFKRVGGCRDLAAKAEAILARSLQALANRDVPLAQQVLTDDQYIDRLQEKICRRIEHELDVAPENASPLLKLEYVTRQLERIGDLATNIAEEVIYLVEGRIVRHDKRLIERLLSRSADERPGFRQVW